MRTLIVDHGPHERGMLRQLCEADASIREVTVAECRVSALEVIRATQPDLLHVQTLYLKGGQRFLRTSKDPGAG